MCPLGRPLTPSAPPQVLSPPAHCAAEPERTQPEPPIYYRSGLVLNGTPMQRPTLGFILPAPPKALGLLLRPVAPAAQILAPAPGCSHCSAALAAQHNFCSHCGTRTGQQPLLAVKREQQFPDPKADSPGDVTSETDPTEVHQLQMEDATIFIDWIHELSETYIRMQGNTTPDEQAKKQAHLKRLVNIMQLGTVHHAIHETALEVIAPLYLIFAVIPVMYFLMLHDPSGLHGLHVMTYFSISSMGGAVFSHVRARQTSSTLS